MFKKSILLTFLLFLSSVTLSYSLSPLISNNELAGINEKKNIHLIDIRSSNLFNEGHIFNSKSAPYSKFRGPKNNPGELINEKNLELLYENLGLDFDNEIIIISKGNNPTDFGAASRVYWTLKSSGFNKLSILNGGIDAWKNDGYKLTTESKIFKTTNLNINFSKKWTATTNDIVEINQKNLNTLLLDARPANFYDGKKKHNAAKSAGTLPSAKNFDFNNFFVENNPIISETGINQGLNLLKSINIDNYNSTVSFCNTGHWAATNWFLLSEIIGKDNIKLYPGSMVEYSNLKLPLQNNPSLLDNLVDSLGVN